MKVAILAGGAGLRLSEETALRPKPMVEIGGRPILWHIMKHYESYGHRDFVIALGYRGDVIRDYFVSECAAHGPLRIDFSGGQVGTNGNGHANGHAISNWMVELSDTGEHTMTGGRIKRLQPLIGDETFMLTWGDGVSDVHLDALLEFHRSHGKLATVTAVRPPGRFGCLEIQSGAVRQFREKPADTRGWINGAFFVLEPQVFDYIDGDATHWEHEPMERLAAEGQLMAWQHESFWQCMDTLKEKQFLEELWQSGNPPWKSWN